MTQRIGYTGIPEFNRPRKLTETVENAPYLEDIKPPETDQRRADTEQLYRSVAFTYLKGRKLLKGLSTMEPAAFIPIEGDSPASTSALRLYEGESVNGTIITYSMFQKSVDYLYGQKWKLRKMYLKGNFPVTGIGQAELISKQERTTENKGLLREFIEGNGVAGAALGILCMTPFMSDVFLALSSEEAAAKSSHLVKTVAGIAILIEIGLKVAKIIEIIKIFSGNKIPNLEQMVEDLNSNPAARDKALADVGIDASEIRESAEPSDHRRIVDYVSEYYNRYGGLAGPESFLTIDHWVAYMQVSQNQLLLRGALNNADTYSDQFYKIKQQGNLGTAADPFISSSSTTESNFTGGVPQFNISVELASVTLALREKSDTIYDDILNAFMYQITDRDLCCLVSLFGALENTDMLRMVAAILRVLSMDLSLEIANLFNALRKFITNLLTGILFELINQIDKVMQKVLLKLVDAFTVNIEALKYCIGLLSIAWALLDAVRVFFSIVKDLVRELITIINDYGKGDDIGFSAAADRKHLLGISRLLEVIATRLDAANLCEINRGPKTTSSPFEDVEFRRLTAGDAVYEILGKFPPTLGLTNQEIETYFPNQQSRTSKRFKFKYGIVDMQNSKTEEASDCVEPLPKDLVDEIASKISKAFNG